MAMESGSLELKVICCKDLKAFNFFQKLSVYAQASIAGDDPEKKLKESQRQKQRTPADKEGDGNPEWKHEMRFDLKGISFHDCDHVFIHFELKHEGAMFGDKTIGEVHVPFKDLVMGSNGIVRFVNYEVTNTEGKSNGVLSFSYKVNGNDTFIGSDSPEIDITGYPIAHHHDQGSGIQYPPLDVHSSEPEIHHPVLNSPPPGVVYPPLELQNTPETPQGVQNSSPRWQHPHQESYYPQPNATYYPPPPPPPPGFSYPPPGPPPTPPPHLAHGEIYHHHHHPHPHPHPHHHPSPGFNPWQPEPQMGFHSYSMPGTWDPAAAANTHPYGNGETSPNGFRAGRDHRSSSWNGR